MFELLLVSHLTYEQQGPTPHILNDILITYTNAVYSKGFMMHLFQNILLSETFTSFSF